MPVWPCWSGRLLEGDVDWDVADAVDAECGFCLQWYDQPDSGGIGMIESRKRLNAGLFTQLFDRFSKAGFYFKLFGGKYYVVVLVCLAMQVGATISNTQIAHARSLYRSAGLHAEGIEQFGKALDTYKNGRPYDFEALRLYERLEEKAKWNKTHPKSEHVSPANRHGLRYFEDGKGITELERSKLDQEAPDVCGYCGKAEPDLQADQKMKTCAKCVKEHYCSKKCQADDWKVHKSSCFTPQEQKKRVAEGKGPGDIYTFGQGMAACVPYPAGESANKFSLSFPFDLLSIATEARKQAEAETWTRSR